MYYMYLCTEKNIWYNKLSSEIETIIFPIFFTFSSRLRPCFGRDEAISLLVLLSYIYGNAVSWAFTSTMFFWAWLWLIMPRKTYYGPITTDGTTAIYKVTAIILYKVINKLLYTIILCL